MVENMEAGGGARLAKRGTILTCFGLLLRQQHYLKVAAAGGQGLQPLSSTADPKGAIGGLDFVIALALCTSREPERTLSRINDDAARALVWVIDKLVKTHT